MNEVCRAVKDYNSSLKVIASGYADYRSVGCMNPLKLPEVAHKVEADGVLIDIKVKNGKGNLFNFLTDKELYEFVKEAHSSNLLVALAGSLDKKDVAKVYGLDADIIGVRGAVCTDRDRLGEVQREKIIEFAKEINNLRKTN